MPKTAVSDTQPTATEEMWLCRVSEPPQGADDAGRRPGGAFRPTGAVKPIKAPKAANAAECQTLEQLPNIGPSLAADLRLIGIERPSDLCGQDAFVLYRKLCMATGQRQDPCVLDTFMAATDFMGGAPAAPWWNYTAQRKASFGAV